MVPGCPPVSQYKVPECEWGATSAQAALDGTAPDLPYVVRPAPPPVSQFEKSSELELYFHAASLT